MARSEQLATDGQVREVVRQMADAAPMAPAWSRLTHAPARPIPTPPRGRGAGLAVLVLAAVAVALVIGAMALRIDPAEVPADVPEASVPTVEGASLPPVRSPFALSDLEPIDAQWCVERHNLVAVRTHIDELSANSDDLAGLTDGRSRLAVYSRVAGPLHALAAHPDLDPDQRVPLADAADAYVAADALSYAGSDGVDSEAFSAALTDWEQAVDALVAASSTTWAGCEPTAGGLRDVEIAASRVRCATATALDDGLRRLAGAELDAPDDQLVVAVARSLGGWYDRTITEESRVADEVALVLSGAGQDRAADLAQLRDDLAALLDDPTGPCGTTTTGQQRSLDPDPVATTTATTTD